MEIKFKVGDKFLTPSGIISIKQLVKKVTSKYGTGYRVTTKIVIPFDEFERWVAIGLWKKIN